MDAPTGTHQYAYEDPRRATSWLNGLGFVGLGREKRNTLPDFVQFKKNARSSGWSVSDVEAATERKASPAANGLASFPLT